MHENILRKVGFALIHAVRQRECHMASSGLLVPPVFHFDEQEHTAADMDAMRARGDKILANRR